MMAHSEVLAADCESTWMNETHSTGKSSYYRVAGSPWAPEISSTIFFSCVPGIQISLFLLIVFSPRWTQEIKTYMYMYMYMFLYM